MAQKWEAPEVYGMDDIRLKVYQELGWADDPPKSLKDIFEEYGLDYVCKEVEAATAQEILKKLKEAEDYACIGGKEIHFVNMKFIESILASYGVKP